MKIIKKYQMLDYIPQTPLKEYEVNKKRLFFVNESNNTNRKVYYLITREFRFNDNFALQYAKMSAEQNNKELSVIFNTPVFDISSKNKFFYDEFEKTKQEFQNNEIDFKIFTNREDIKYYLEENKPFLLIKDFNPLEENQLDSNDFTIIEIDGRNIIPARYISSKQEYNAATLRKKIYLNLAEFITEYPSKSDTYDILIQDFVERKLPLYAEFKNNPVKKITSGFSKYLNWGFMSSQRLALEVIRADTTRENKEVFLEELIVRQELSDNFCLYCKDFKSLNCIPSWAKKTLSEHKTDFRPHLYSLEELEQANTYDELWNASQRQLLKEGRIEGYLRMYWAKMLLLWTPDAQQALDYAIYLNDKYAFDAPSANGYTGILWSIGGLHDRAFAQRPVTGKIRPMTFKGAKSKFDVNAYINSYQD